MLTTEIPEVNSRKSAEDELAQFILDKLKTQNEVCIEYYHAGCAKGKNRITGIGNQENITRIAQSKGNVRKPFL